jgi:small conductance mechanosensitive channel
MSFAGALRAIASRSHNGATSLTLQAGAIFLASSIVSPIQAQLPLLPDLNLPTPNLLNQNSDDQVVSGCIRLDGRCLFKIADQKSDLPNRITGIEQRLNDISRIYFNNDSSNLKIRKQKEEKLPNIYISVADKEVRLLSVTAPDADLKGVDLDTRADELIEQLEEGLTRAKQERQPQFLAQQGGIATGTGVFMLVASLAIYRWERRSKRSKDQFAHTDSSPLEQISTQLTQKEQWNVKEVQHRLFQLTQAGILAGGTLFILGLFPYTRMIQILMIASLRIPLRVGMISLGTYVLIRLCYALIDRFAAALARNYLLTPEANRRLQLRVSTISGVTKGIVTVAWIGVGVLVTLSAIGVNIGPLLAGAGLIGVAVSLASQNLIKDAINGFFIILEDQYALGDVIAVDKVSGLVETMNLRITQLRDSEGRLITIPNSEIVKEFPPKAVHKYYNIEVGTDGWLTPEPLENTRFYPMTKHYILSINPNAEYDWEQFILRDPITAVRPDFASLIAEAVGDETGSYLVAVNIEVKVLEKAPTPQTQKSPVDIPAVAVNPQRPELVA